MKKIILASTSPRRKEILSKTGLDFEIIESNYEEDMTLPMLPAELVEHLSRGKAEAVFENNRDAIVIAADTFVVFDNKVLGKPKGKEEAREMLEDLSGKENDVITGVTIMTDEKTVTFSQITKVFMKEMSAEEIDNYIATGEPLDKAGAYALQDLGAILIDRMEGDFFNAMGLPLRRLAEELKNFGIKLL